MTEPVGPAGRRFRMMILLLERPNLLLLIACKLQSRHDFGVAEGTGAGLLEGDLLEPARLLRIQVPHQGPLLAAQLGEIGGEPLRTETVTVAKDRPALFREIGNRLHLFGTQTQFFLDRTLRQQEKLIAVAEPTQVLVDG